MINAGEVIIASLVIIALLETFYLRKDLEAHGLKTWVYAGFPLMTVTTLILVAWHELPLSIAEPLVYAFGALTVLAFFIGTVIAFRRR